MATRIANKWWYVCQDLSVRDHHAYRMLPLASGQAEPDIEATHNVVIVEVFSTEAEAQMFMDEGQP